jgi:hypothetical protein
MVVNKGKDIRGFFQFTKPGEALKALGLICDMPSAANEFSLSVISLRSSRGLRIRV